MRLLELRPDLLVAFGLADTLISSGGRACPPAAPTPACQVLAGLSLLKANHFPEAARILEPIVASFPDLHTIPFASGVVAYLGRDYRQAERQLERALSLYPTHAQTRLYLGHVLFDPGGTSRPFLTTRHTSPSRKKAPISGKFEDGFGSAKQSCPRSSALGGIARAARAQ